MFPNFKISHMPVYIPLLLQHASNSRTFFSGIKIRPFFQRRWSWDFSKCHLITYSIWIPLFLSPLLLRTFIFFPFFCRKHFFVHTPTPPIHINYSLSTYHCPQLPCVGGNDMFVFLCCCLSIPPSAVSLILQTAEQRASYSATTCYMSRILVVHRRKWREKSLNCFCISNVVLKCIH